MKWAESSKWVENTVGKGEIALYEQFLFFPKCFQKTCTADKDLSGKGLMCIVSRMSFAWGFMPYQRYFSYLTATVHKSMFSGLFFF